MKKKIIFWLLIIASCLGCNRQNDNKNSHCAEAENGLLNESLKRVILEYVRSNQDAMGPTPYLLEKRQGRTETVYRFTGEVNLQGFLDSKVECFIRLGDLLIGYRDMTSRAKGMKLSEIANALKDDFPDLYESYLLYRKERWRINGNAKMLFHAMTDYEVWEARFIGDSLTSCVKIFPPPENQ